jgi:hypothetical protein
MTTNKIQEIVEASVTLSESASSLLSDLVQLEDETGKNFDVKINIPGAENSVSDLISKISILCGMIEKFEKSPNDTMVPVARITDLKTSLDAARANVDKLKNTMNSVIEAGGGLKSFNYSNFQLQTKNGKNHIVQPHFVTVYNSVEALLEAYFDVLVIMKPTKANSSFQAAANNLSGIIGNTNDQYKRLKVLFTEAEKNSQAVEAYNSEISKTAMEANRLKEGGEADRKTISEYLADATDKAAAVSNIHTEAKHLEAKVSNYQVKFDTFKEQLEAREKTFHEGTINLEALIAEYDAQKSVIAALITQSEQMLKGATVAGLAGSFDTIRKEISTELTVARWTFYLGILFLFVSAIPLMAFVFMPILEPLLTLFFPALDNVSFSTDINSGTTGWQYLGQVSARLIILSPAAWFVSFTAIRHSSLFRLREHYSYKYSMAVSVEGFKKQAAGYEGEIAALVLEQLAFNPADKLVHSKETREANIPQPMLNYFMKKLRGNIDDITDGTK